MPFVRCSPILALLLTAGLSLQAQMSRAPAAKHVILVLQRPVDHVLPQDVDDAVSQDVSIPYNGAVKESHPALYVRVFRASLADLRNAKPRQPHECVVFALTTRLRVQVTSDEFGKNLVLKGLASFFAASHDDTQTMTLVFEEGDDPATNGAIGLEPGADVSTYFDNAVEVPLRAVARMRAAWDVKRLQDQKAAQERAEAEKPSFFRLTRVKAATRLEPTPPTAPPLPAVPASVYVKPCHTVRPVTLSELQLEHAPTVALAEATGPAEPEALAPVAERTALPCGQ